MNESICIVKEGDTLEKIAEFHDTTVDKLVSLNNINPNVIHPGMEFKLAAYTLLVRNAKAAATGRLR